jgi:hypothetical protein
MDLRQRENELEEKLDNARKEGINLANRWLVAFFATLGVTILSVITAIIFWIKSRTPVNPRYEPIQVLSPREVRMLEAFYEKAESFPSPDRKENRDKSS